MFNLYDSVKIIDKESKSIIKEGIIVALTTIGANVYDPKCVYPFVDSAEQAEWFPFESVKTKMIATNKFKKRV